jgi:hypothetical protein
VIGVLVNPNFPGSAFQLKDVQEAAQTLQRPIQVLNASTSGEINTAFATIAQQQIDALLVAGDPFFLTRAYPIDDTRGTACSSHDLLLTRIRHWRRPD